MEPVTQKSTRNLNMLGSNQKKQLAETGFFRGSRGQTITPGTDGTEVVTPKVNPLSTPRLNPTIPEVIPSTALAGNKTFEDVMDTRADLETQATAKQQLTDRIEGIGNRVNTTTTASFSDPDAIINRLALNRVPTETESQRAAKQASAVQNRRDYAGDIATARTQANEQFGVPDLVARKAEVTQQYAEREAKMDNDIKRLEENASKRGVARQYVDAEKQKIKSDALEDLANYAAIEAAVSGSITEARSIINDTINDKKASFELENQSIQQEIDYLSTLVGEDNKREATQLQMALDERKRLQDAQLAKESDIKNLTMEAIKAGADSGTYQAMLKAGSVEEAMRYAAPFLRPKPAGPTKLDTAFDKDGNLINMQTGEVIRSAQEVGNFPGGQEGARQYEIQKADIQMGYNTAKELLNNKVGLDLATGAFQSPLAKTLLTNVGGSVAGFGAAGTVVPGIGTAVGALTGLGAGLATAPFAYSFNKTQQDNFLAGTSFLINDSTFAEIRDLKAQGVTFGNMTEGERIAAGRAATNLASAAELDESGKVEGFRGDANTIKGYIQDIMKAYEGRQEYLDKQYAITPEDESEAADVWATNNQ